MIGILVGGTASGVGKTTVTLAILAALRRRGLEVQPFKGGPDFLDGTHHTRVAGGVAGRAGRVSRNVDTWMLPREANRELVGRAAAGADAVVVEGMMGLFDGKGAGGEEGSSGEIAKLLGLPVVLVVDAAKSARSVAAVVLGFEEFDPELRLAGVVLNRVASERHGAMLREAIPARCRTPVLGCFPREAEIAIPERHLGLHAAAVGAEEAETERWVDRLAGLAERWLDMDALLGLNWSVPEISAGSGAYPEARVRIGVARDAAFSFLYEDNLHALRAAGAELVFFSPLRDGGVPEEVDALYLAGGYPELHAEGLERNAAMRASVSAFASSGRVVYAECGGMLYLLDRLRGADGVSREMCGVLRAEAEMTGRLQGFGYVEVKFERACVLGAAGTAVRGHSFHYSRLVGKPVGSETTYRVRYSLGGREEVEGFGGGNVLASYVHLHFGAGLGLAEALVEASVRAMRELSLTPA